MQAIQCRCKADAPAWFYAMHIEKRTVSDVFSETVITLGAPMTIENVLASTVRSFFFFNTDIV